MEPKQERSEYWNFAGGDAIADLRKVKPAFTWRRGDMTLLEWLELEVSDNNSDNDGDNNQDFG